MPSSGAQPTISNRNGIQASDNVCNRASNANQAITSEKTKVRNIDVLLENLKKDQAERDKRKELGIEPTGVPISEEDNELTTNLFVGNLAPELDEHALVREFGRFGPIGSVKIMWPRDEEQRLRGRNTGFVAFMNRKDAEKARDALDGVALCGFLLQVGWGKAVPLPAIPVWPPPGELLGSNAAALGIMPNPEATRQRKQDGPPPKSTVIGRGKDIDVTFPEDPRIKFVIDAMSYFVSKDGCEFEQVIMSRECENPEFAFLFDVDSPEHAYYRWRVFSLSSGDSLRSWRIDPFLMVEGSNRWLPPPMTLAATAGTKSNTSSQDVVSLPQISRDKFINVLKSLTVHRQSISDAMVFALDNAEYAEDITAMIAVGIEDKSLDAAAQIAHLFLISDILHNTTAQVRNASKFRTRLQEILPDVFEVLSRTYRQSDGRIAQEKLRKYVLGVAKIWRSWYAFSDEFIDGLQATFLKNATSLDGKPIIGGESNHDPAEIAKLASLTDEELEMKCKHKGLSRKGGRQAQINRLLGLLSYLKNKDYDHGTKSSKVEQNTPVTRKRESYSEPNNFDSSGWVELPQSDKVESDMSNDHKDTIQLSKRARRQ